MYWRYSNRAMSFTLKNGTVIGRLQPDFLCQWLSKRDGKGGDDAKEKPCVSRVEKADCKFAFRSFDINRMIQTDDEVPYLSE